MNAAARCVVFAYSEVGARCLGALFEAGVDVCLVVTHEDDPNEQRWFASVAEVARGAGCPVVTPADPAEPALGARIAALAPDFIFSFYYRRMLPPGVLALARRGALNMHGSLLPRYRGRAPVNWAVLNGETETGASLHYMVAKPDAGALVDQEAVPIGPDDTAFEVAGRVADAAVTVLRRSLPRLVAGTATATPLDLARGSYYGGRKPADGEFALDWPAARIHNLVRAVAPPFPGAYLRLGDALLRVNRTRRLEGGARHGAAGPCLVVEDGRLTAECGDGARLELLDAYLDEARLDPARFIQTFGHEPVPARPRPRAQARA
ncbi:MAG TPA: formyltransferase [Steroidobacteraceae bacterium]|nr:formyltransferase [Steroidobacteraceae bacterium]